MTHRWTIYRDGCPESPICDEFEAATLGDALALLAGDAYDCFDDHDGGDHTLTLEVCRDIDWCEGSGDLDVECRCGATHDEGDMRAIGNVWTRRVLVGVTLDDGRIEAIRVPDCGPCGVCAREGRAGRIRLEPLADNSGLRGERCDECGARWMCDPPREMPVVGFGGGA